MEKMLRDVNRQGKTRTPYKGKNKKFRAVRKSYRPEDPALKHKLEEMIAWTKSSRDLGTPFYHRASWGDGGVEVHGKSSSLTSPYNIDGRVLPYAGIHATPSLISSSPEADLFTIGGAVVRLAAPTNPHASLAVALGELKHEGLPDVPMWRSYRKASFKALDKQWAHEHLNIEFGWKPLVGDIKDAIKAYNKADALWRKAYENSNKPIRRHRVMEPIVTTTHQVLSTSAYPWPSGVTYLHSSPGTLRKTVESTTEHWFDGCFRYHIPKPATPSKKITHELARLRYLYGLSLDPDTLWNLIPWTWLLDWFISYGGLMKAISLFGQDGLVLQYGYLMEHKLVKTTWTLSGHSYYRGGSGDSSYTQFQETKRRVRASPFGFGKTSKDLTPRQWAILAAVGISLR